MTSELTEARRPRMLVVDDEVAICELIAEVASAAHFDVDSASSLADIDRLLGGGHDVTVLDLELGRPEDDDAVRTLAVRQPGAHVVFMSGSSASIVADAHRRAASYGLSVVGSCRKPFDLKAFRRVLERCDELRTD